MKFKSLLILTIFILIGGCSKETETEIVTKYVGCTKPLEEKGDCLRWMDRTIYFAFSSANTPNRNNEFQKAKVKEAFEEIQEITSLGRDYFNFKEVDEGLLSPIIEPGLNASQYRSFILIWPDNEFNNFVVNTLGGNTPDPNAVTIINSAYKRKFYMIIRASCFVSEAACNGITTPGLRALIARQLGMLTGIRPSDCATEPDNVMCATLPSDDQWDEVNKARWSSTENNNLEVILNNPNFYDEFVPSTE